MALFCFQELKNLHTGLSIEKYRILKNKPISAHWINMDFLNKFYSHQLMHFFIQLCISLLSYIKIT